MSKDDLVRKLATDVGINLQQAKEALSSVLNSITLSLEEGEKISFVGFGSFSVKDRPARSGRNPKTNEPMEIPAKKVPVFKAGKNLKDAVS